MFEKASRLKLRFAFNGVCGVEDLWDLSPTNLDKIYKALKAEAKAKEGDSLLDTKTKEDDILALKIDIVKYIYTVKDAEKKARATAAEDASFNKMIDDMVARKKLGEMESMSVEDLLKLKK